jgi:hypothetical protein
MEGIDGTLLLGNLLARLLQAFGHPGGSFDKPISRAFVMGGYNTYAIKLFLRILSSALSRFTISRYGRVANHPDDRSGASSRRVQGITRDMEGRGERHERVISCQTVRPSTDYMFS